MKPFRSDPKRFFLSVNIIRPPTPSSVIFEDNESRAALGPEIIDVKSVIDPNHLDLAKLAAVEVLTAEVFKIEDELLAFFFVRSFGVFKVV